MIAALLPQDAQAQVQTTTSTTVVTGTLKTGAGSVDHTGVFGTIGNIGGAPFTLTYTYEQAIGLPTTTLCSGTPCKTQLEDNSGSSSPGTVVVQVNSGSYTISNSTGSTVYRTVAPLTAEVDYNVANNANGNASGSTFFGNATSSTVPPWTSDANYWDAFTYSATPTILPGGSFTIYYKNPGTGVVEDSATAEYDAVSFTVNGTTIDSSAKTMGGPDGDSDPDGDGPYSPISFPQSGGGGASHANGGSGPNGGGKCNSGPSSYTGGMCPGGNNAANGDTSGSAFRGEPINIVTGNVFYHETDYTTAGQNPLTFKRYYNSQGNTAQIAGILIVTNATTLGVNWRSNYDRYLQIGASTVNAERPDGQIVTFTLTGGTWTPDADIDMTLTNSGSTWTLTDHYDTVETYTAIGAGTLGQLNTIQKRNGYTQTMAYNGSNQLATVTDSYSRVLTLTYSGALLQSVATPDSTTINYGYIAAGTSNVLNTVSYPTTPATGFTYNYANASFPYMITSITDGASQTFISWGYDAHGRGTSSQFGSGADLTSLTYNSDGSTTVTNALGVADTYSFTPQLGTLKLNQIARAATATTTAMSESFSYDKNGYLNNITDWNGNQTFYINDSHGDPTGIYEALTTTVARTTTIAYDATFVHLPDTVTTTGLTTTYTYDGSGNVLTKKDTDTTTTSIPYSTNGQTRTTTFTWSATGEMLTVQLPRTDVVAKTTFLYGADGALTKITDAVGNITQITSHSGGGYPLTISDPNSVVTTNTYDGGMRLLTSALTTGAGVLTTTATYDTAGNLASLEKPDNSKLSFTHDTAHRLTKITDLIGNTVTYTLDALGDRTATVIKDPTPTTQKSTSATFDALGRMLTFVGGMSQTTTFTYDDNGNVLTVKDPMLNTVTNTWDALNRLSTVKDPSPGGTTTYTYNTHDSVLSVKDPNAHTTSYVYDGFQDRIQTASPDAGTSVYHFNPDRDVTQATIPTSMTANMTYDADDRWLTTAYPSDATLNVSNTYDQAGHGFGIGRLTSATDQAGSLSLTYDERGNVTAESRVIGLVGTLNTATAYDAASNVSSITYPSGTVVAYGRDSMGKATSVTAQPPGAGSPSNVATGVTYEPFGPVTGLSFGNGITGTYTYDNDYRPTARTDAATATVLGLSYGYNANDNVTGITDSVTAANTQTLGYDALNRLSSAASGAGGYGTWSWTWDAGSNVKTQVINGTTTTYSLTSGTNKLSQWVTGATTETVTSTASGNINLLKVGATTLATYDYNQANQLKDTTVSGTTATYAYGLFGQRLEKTVGAGNPVLYQYSVNDGTLLSENDLHAGDVADYIYLNGTPIGQVNPGTGAIYFVHSDLLGTPDSVTDSTETVVWNALYQPFGATTPTGTLATQNLRYPGQEYDAANSLNHNGFRNYSPGITRYIQADLLGIGTPAGKAVNDINIYQYVRGNTFTRIDPIGLYDIYISAGFHIPLSVGVSVGKTASFTVYSSDPNNLFTYTPLDTEVEIGVIGDAGFNVGVTDLSGTNGLCNSGTTVSYGFGKYFGFSIQPRLSQDTTLSLFNPLRYIDGFSLNFGGALPIFNNPISVSSITK